jgi:Tol biopolymer transport system component
MSSHRARSWLRHAPWCWVGALWLIAAANLVAATAVPISTPEPSLQSQSGDSDSYPAGISDDGRLVVFVSRAQNLVLNDGNGATDVFVRDLEKQQTILVSESLHGRSGNGPSIMPTISADGRYVTFQSLASDLVAGDENGTSDVFVRDLLLKVTRLVSVEATGSQTGNGASTEPAMSPDGRFVAFASLATDLLAPPVIDTNRVADVFLRDLHLEQTWPVSVSTNSQKSGKGPSTSPTINADGRIVAFRSTATDLVRFPRAQK